MDIFSKNKRSQIMSKIRSSGTKPEILVKKYLFSNGYRFRKNVKSLPGKPDIVLPKYKTVIFVHGCFWHGHKNCRRTALPSTRKSFWKNKIAGNIKRDAQNIKILKKLGWQVLIIWQCKLSNLKVRNKTLNRILHKLS